MKASYVQIINHFWDVQRMREDIGTDEISVYLLIADFANRQFWPQWAEVSTVKARALLALSKSRWSRAIHRLIEAGLLEYTEGTRSISPKYRLILGQYGAKTDEKPTKTKRESTEKADLNCDLNRDPLYKREKREQKQREGGAASAASDLDSVISEVEAMHPKRSDVRAIALRVMDRHPDREMTVKRLCELVDGERDKKFKPKPKAPQAVEPDGWQDHAPGNLSERSWQYVFDNYPDVAAEIHDKLKGSADAA